MKNEGIKISKSKAILLAKYLLGKGVFLEKNYMGYVFKGGVIKIEIEDISKSYDKNQFLYFGNDLETEMPYLEPCYKVWWYIDGVDEVQIAYYKMNETYEPIFYINKPEEE